MVKNFDKILTNGKFCVKIVLSHSFSERNSKMKQIISMVIVCMLLVGMMLTLVSCAGGIDNGSYASSSGDVVEIDGNKYTATVNKGGYSFKVTYTYEVKDSETDPDKQVICFTYDSTDASGDVKAALEAEEPFSYTYEKVEGGFIINGSKYTKK